MTALEVATDTTSDLEDELRARENGGSAGKEEWERDNNNNNGTSFNENGEEAEVTSVSVQCSVHELERKMEKLISKVENLEERVKHGKN